MCFRVLPWLIVFQRIALLRAQRAINRLGSQRQGRQPHAHRVVYRIGDRRRDAERPGLAHALRAVERGGPFGAKGVGETGTFGVSPAIANAIDDAVGVRLTSLPLTAEAVFRALRTKAGNPLKD